MWDEIIKKELNKTIINFNKKKIKVPEANKKLNELAKLTRTNVQPGRKRQLKKSIFDVKRQFRL